MNRVIRKTSIISSVVVFFIIILTFITFYFPIKKELEASYLENFKLLVESKIQHLQHFTNRSVEGAKTISSRTAINNKIIEYKNREVNLEELKAFTKSNSRYEEGAKVLSNIIGAVRVVDDKVIAKYGIINHQKIQKLEEEGAFLYDIELKDETLYMTVYSPILNKDKILGYDIVSFDMSNYLEQIIDKKIKIEFLHKEAIYTISEDEIILEDNKPTRLESEEHIGYLYKIAETDDYIYIYTLKSLLYGPPKKIINISYTAFLFSLIGFIIVLDFIVLKKANKVLYDVELSRDRYKKKAYKDALTGVYSRGFLNMWIEKVYKKSKLRDNFYSIAMIDGNDFKKINDNYGHSIGDKVLIIVAEVLEDSVRDNDIVIRYGGDEFLIIFENCKRETVYSVFKRIESKLSDINEFEFNIGISYGIYEIKNKEDFYEALNIADRKMYEFKKNKKTLI